jgi:cyclopropane-fatty-acyl-phospholipid synthase
MAFRHTGLMVMQLQLARDIGAVPVTRDYMFREEELLKHSDEVPPNRDPADRVES